MAEPGYEVQSHSTLPGKAAGGIACLGVLSLEIIWLFVRPDDTLIVTYRLAR
jgi:hypothetical protein